MANQKTPQIMDQVMSVIDRMAGNPNSGLNTGNMFDFIDKLTVTVSTGYQRVETLAGSTSLTAAVAPAETPAGVEATNVQQPSPAAELPQDIQETVAPEQAAQAVATTETAKAPQASAKSAPPTSVKSAPVSKPAAPKDTAEAYPVVEADAKQEEESAVPPAETQQPPVSEDKDVATAESMIFEHGSALAAAEFIRQSPKRGRKTAWQKIIEERADKELRNAAKTHKKINAQGLASAIANAQKARKEKKSKISDALAAREYSLKTTGYPFSHIDRKPVVDAEKALGAKITCLIDGVKKTMMSRYIAAKYAMSPEEYIAHFDLRPDYPMTADLYRTEKRRLAGEQGLGQRKEGDEAPAPVEQATPATNAATNRRSRSRAA